MGSVRGEGADEGDDEGREGEEGGSGRRLLGLSLDGLLGEISMTRNSNTGWIWIKWMDVCACMRVCTEIPGNATYSFLYAKKPQ